MDWDPHAERTATLRITGTNLKLFIFSLFLAGRFVSPMSLSVLDKARFVPTKGAKGLEKIP